MQGIKKKLLTSFFAVILLLLISEGFFAAMNYIILSKYATLTSNIVSEYSLIDSTDALLKSYNNRIKSPSDETEIAAFNSAYASTENLLSKLRKNIVDAKSRSAFLALENNIKDVFFNIEIGVNNLAAGDYLEAVSRYDAASRKNSFVRENTTSLLLRELEYAKNMQISIENVRSISQAVAILLVLFTVVACVAFAISFSNWLISPLINLTKLAKVIENGNLGATVDEKLLGGTDEVASLANSFTTMVASLKINIEKLQESNVEIKNSRDRLKSERNKLQKYLDTAGVIVLVCDFNSHVTIVNKKCSELLGYTAEEIIGKDWISDYVVKKNQVQTKSMLAFLENNKTTVDTLENVIIARDKSEKNIVWHFSILPKENNISPSYLATGVDITELTKARVTINQLREVDKLKSEVLNIATHELKTPLISIIGLSEVMIKKPESISEDYKNYISIIHYEGEKLNTLIKTMLTASRNEVSKVAVVKEKFNLGELLTSLNTSLEMLSARTESHIKINIGTKKINIESDKAKISQVIYNFVDNAIKYGPKNQVIEISVFLIDNIKVRVEVKGAGKGIPKDLQKKLFMKFSQLEPSLSRSQDGMGLGLYICKQNIDSLGGEIGVQSEENQGATFYFTLPL